jgi:uracil-DNA glycosylase family protein
VKPTGSAADFIPPRPTLAKMRASVQDCRGCDLYKFATQAVFGAGPARARLIVVGEQPGDVEDREGVPFVGPSGKLFDRALEAAGIDRGDVYVTNAVKHFKFAREARTKRRIHKSPSTGEVRACRPWLEHEIALIGPEIILCLGATAAKALLGSTFSVTKSRGKPIESEWGPEVYTTVHPSAVLRAPRDDRKAAEAAFFADIGKVAARMAKGAARGKRAGRQEPKFTTWPTTAHRSRTSNAATRSSPG